MKQESVQEEAKLGDFMMLMHETEEDEDEFIQEEDMIEVKEEILDKYLFSFRPFFDNLFCSLIYKYTRFNTEDTLCSSLFMLDICHLIT